MKTLKKLLLLKGYVIEGKEYDHAFKMKQTSGSWEKIVFISNWRKLYEVHCIEGTSDFIKYSEITCHTINEVIKFLGIHR